MDDLIGKIVVWNNKNMDKQYIGIVKSISFPNQTALIYGCGDQMPRPDAATVLGPDQRAGGI